MTMSRAWLGLAVLLAPAIAAAQPGPDDSQAAPAPPIAAPAAAPLPTYAPPPDGDYGGGAPSQTMPRIVDHDAPPPPPKGSRKDPAVAGWMSGLVTGGGLLLMVAAQNMDDHSDYDSNSRDTAQLLGTVGAIAFIVGPTTGHIYAGHTWNTSLGVRLASAAAITIGVAMLVADDDGNNNNGDMGAALFVGGAFGYGISTITEIVTAPGAADDYNREHGFDAQLTFAPVRDARNATSPGVGLVGHF